MPVVRTYVAGIRTYMADTSGLSTHANVLQFGRQLVGACLPQLLQPAATIEHADRNALPPAAVSP